MTDPDMTCDVLVVGGGVNGAAIARDAAMRGLRVILLEKDDISHAASAWNSRMIHGGIRYLETYEIDLVRESLHEREWLLHSAPHLVKPLPFLMPFLRRNRRSPWLLRLGMLAYDVLSFDKSLPHHRLLGKQRTLQLAPGLSPDEVRGGALFYDAQAQFVERLGVETAVSAVEHGARVLTHHRAVRLRLDGRLVTGVDYRDELTGATGSVEARVTVNVTGPWVDEMLATLPEPPAPLVVRSKGTHLLVDPFEGAPKQALYYEAKRDGRAMLILPWRGHWLLGSTDLRFDGDIDSVDAAESEIDYILDETNDLIASAHLTRDQVRYHYTGVRPLPFSEGDTTRITRRHIIHDHRPEFDGLLTVIGGKLTTFRSLGAQAGDRICDKLGTRRTRGHPDEPLPGGRPADLRRFTEVIAAGSDLAPDVARRLEATYGGMATDIIDRMRRDPSSAAIIEPGHGITRAEIEHVVDAEFARTLSDVLMRRTMVGLDPDITMSSVTAIATAVAEVAGWDGTRLDDEVNAYLSEARVPGPDQRVASGNQLA